MFVEQSNTEPVPVIRVAIHESWFDNASRSWVDSKERRRVCCEEFYGPLVPLLHFPFSDIN
jgi:hypothetical protein